jgi:heparanase 1
VRAAVLLLLAAGCSGRPAASHAQVSVLTRGPAAEVDPRFLSVAIDASQVMGGTFWTAGGSGPVSPFDFTRPRLQRLARELAPAFLRLGGTEADKAYYDLDGTYATPPGKYRLLLTRNEWDSLHSFAASSGFDVMFTLNAGPGPRDAANAWTDTNARALLAYSAAHGQHVAVWELGNELNGYLFFHGPSNVVSPAQYADDLRSAKAMIAQLMPGARLAGPSSAYWPTQGEPVSFMPAFMPIGGASLDLITWHYYPQQSRRCPLQLTPATPERLLMPAALNEIDTWAAQVESARDAHSPASEVWLGETGNAQCGGEPGVSDRFVASLWWLDQLGRLAVRGQRVVVRQTLAGADYGLLDDQTLEPRPDYWASLLWKRWMGARVLATRGAPDDLRVYAHCAPGGGGAVTVVAINLSRTAPATLSVDLAAQGAAAFFLTATDLLSPQLLVNGALPAVALDGTPPALVPAPLQANAVIAPASAAFVLFPAAAAPACQP